MTKTRIISGLVVAAVLALVPSMAIAHSSSSQPVDPPQQVAQLRQQYEGLSPEQIRAAGYEPEGPCVPNPQGPGAMGIHFINPEYLELSSPRER